jgi:hypothetical protein
LTSFVVKTISPLFLEAVAKAAAGQDMSLDGYITKW